MQTQTSIYAAKHAANLAKQSLRTIWIVRLLATLILGIGIGVSTPHQAYYLIDRGMDQYSAWAIPISVDLLAAICVKVLSTAAIQTLGRVSAGVVLLFPLGVSGVINYLAPGDMLVRCAFVVPVLMIPAAEFVASRIRPNFKKLDAMERELSAPLAVVETETVAPVVTPEPVAETSEVPEPVAVTRRRPVRGGRTPVKPLADPGEPMPEELTRLPIEATVIAPTSGGQPNAPAFVSAS